MAVQGPTTSTVKLLLSLPVCQDQGLYVNHTHQYRVATAVVRRPLAPGSYRVVVTARGFANATAEVTVPQDGSGAQQVTPGRRFSI